VGVGWLAAWVAFTASTRLLISVVFINHEVWVHAYRNHPLKAKPQQSMIRLVIGRLDYRGVGNPPAITFKDYDNAIKLGGVPDMELKPLTRLVINKLLNVLGIQFDASNVKRLSDVFEYCVQCSWFSGFINFVDESLPGNAVITVPIPMIEPVSTLIGLALAFNNPTSRFIGFVSESLPGNAVITVPIPMIEPVSTFIGLALAFNNPNFEVELYSDLWPQITD